jgi:uncharacterized protein (DUF952 family)
VTRIYHITAREALLAARESGEYRAESLSDQGFIHFAGAHQLLGVAGRFYAGRQGLVLLVVDVSRLRAELKYELADHPHPSADQLFPHLYGPLNVDAVIDVYDFEPDAGGRFSLPAELITEH